MARKTMIGIRVTEEERKKIEKLARYARLSPSTAARQVLLDLADSLEDNEGKEANQRR